LPDELLLVAEQGVDEQVVESVEGGHMPSW
jgi:hypothetical protein